MENKLLNQKKTINAWAMYDWANSVFSLTITTAIFPVYFETMSRISATEKGAVEAGLYYIDFFGWKVLNTAAYSYALSAAFLLVAVTSPFLSGIADFGGLKKRMMQFFVYLGAFSCACMYFFTEQNIGLGLLLFITAAVGFAGSIVFYNAFLPEIATEDQFDRISAKGYSLGYVGSVILLVFNLVVLLFPDWFYDVGGKVSEIMAADPGLSLEAAQNATTAYYEKLSSRLAFVSVGVWWAGFAQITFWNLPAEHSQGKISRSIMWKGFSELKKVWKQLKALRELRVYLGGFFLVSTGLQTVMYVATLFGSNVLELSADQLIMTVLIIQIIAIAGAMIFSRLSASIGNIYALVLAILIWIGICIFAYFITTATEFYVLAGVVGMVMGGLQSLFRSTYAKLIPENTLNHASFFSFYDVSEKIAIVIGTFAFGFIVAMTGSMRLSTLVLAAFFIAGLFFIVSIKNFKSHRG
jgi:MFS transporter, UMF1 family